MLPFLQKKSKQVGVIVEQRSANGGLSKAYEDDGDAPGALEACARDILEAIAAKDAKKLADAMHAAFQVMELEPHQEAEHEE